MNRSLFAAIICFIVGFVGMWIGRAVLATSIPLMVFVSFWLLMGFLFALHADTTSNLQIIVSNIPVLRGLVNGKAADVPVAPGSPEPPK
jgi:hypothetical protein